MEDIKKTKPTAEEISKMPKPSMEMLEIIQVLGQLNNGKWNVVVFKDTPWLYLQFYMGLHLGKHTILVIRKNDKYFAKRMKHELVKHVIEINDYSDIHLPSFNEHLKKLTK